MSVEVSPPSHAHDQLIVDLQHLETVHHMLTTLAIDHADIAADDQDELLGLARLRNLTDAGGEPVEVGEILGLLRQRAAADRDGLQLMIGKNRDIDAVIDEGHKPMALLFGASALASHKPMSSAEPSPIDAATAAGLPAGAPDAGRGVRIGMVDTPLSPAPAPEGPPSFRAGHGRFVASLISRQAPAAEIHVEGVLKPSTGRANTWDVARAMLRLAATQHVSILNLSLGCYTLSGGPPLIMARAIERLGPEVLVVAAAGNHGALPGLASGRTRHSACWPAGDVPTVAVGAMDDGGAMAPWSPSLPWVTCLASGVDVIGSYLTGPVEMSERVTDFTGHARWSGTSFAAATVSGAIAARTVPGTVTPRQALADLLNEGTVVRPFPGQS